MMKDGDGDKYSNNVSGIEFCSVSCGNLILDNTFYIEKGH